jgi:hypothetical protein
VGVGRVLVIRSMTVVSFAAVALIACSGGSSNTATTTASATQPGVTSVSPATTQPPAATPAPAPVSTEGRTDASQPATTAPASGPTDAEVKAAGAVISAAAIGSAGASALDAVRFTDAGKAAAEQAIATGATGAELWAATWVYTSTASDPAPLVPLFAAPDLSTRALAAAGALSFGERAAAPVLVGLLSDGEQLAGSKPPLTIGQFAASTLTRYIDAPEIRADAAPSDLVAPWTAWLAGPGAGLKFDPESGRWRR